MKKYTLYILVFMLCTSCVEEIDLRNFTSDTILVVEANLTNEIKHHSVKLSRTTPLDSVSTLYETNAIVRIKDDQQNVYLFTEMNNGVYTSTQAFKAEINTNYTLEIKTTDGETYISTPQKVEAINDIDDIKIKIDSNSSNQTGVTIYVTSESENTKANYYKYTYEETYIVRAPYWSLYKLVIGNSPRNIVRNDNLDAEASRTCYKTEKSIDLLQTETRSLSSNSVINFPIQFIKQTDSKIWHRYSIIVKQHIQSYDAYIYYKTLKKLSISENVFSQVQQGFIVGNMNATSNLDKKIIGLFEVNSVSQKRVFFNFIDLFPNHGLSFTKDCLIEAPKIIEVVDGDVSYPLYEALTVRKLRFARDNEVPTTQLPGRFKITKKECVDCRYIASNIKPNFWID
ncbi:MAG: DUF4249 domain-containing protein [Flavobacteriaceae bacterium]|nr:DUF4249 domain-containing protein [Flavobacteriaceae bacterium]